MSTATDYFDYSGQLVYRAFEYTGSDPILENIQTVLPDGAGREALSDETPETFAQVPITDTLHTALSDTRTRMPPRFEAYRLNRYQLGEEIEIWDPNSGSVEAKHRINSLEGEVALLASNRILIRGTQRFVDEVQNHMTRDLDDRARIIPIEFEPDFLLWIFGSQYMSSMSRFEQLSLIRLNGVSFIGDNDTFGNDISLKNTKLTDSGLAHASILSENQFEELSGLFELNGQYIQVKFNSHGRIHIRVAEDLRNRNMAERFITASRVADQLAAEYLRWLELPRDEQYPPARFFQELYEAAKNQGLRLSVDIDDMLEKYAEWRGESLEEYLETE